MRIQTFKEQTKEEKPTREPGMEKVQEIRKMEERFDTYSSGKTFKIYRWPHESFQCNGQGKSQIVTVR